MPLHVSLCAEKIVSNWFKLGLVNESDKQRFTSRLIVVNPRILKEQTEPLQLNSKADTEMEAENEKIEEMSVLEHAAQCKDNKCREKGCHKTKRVINHSKQCKRKADAGCPRCKKLIKSAISHANLCTTVKCPVPYCANIKYKKQQLQ